MSRGVSETRWSLNLEMRLDLDLHKKEGAKPKEQATPTKTESPKPEPRTKLLPKKSSILQKLTPSPTPFSAIGFYVLTLALVVIRNFTSNRFVGPASILTFICANVMAGRSFARILLLIPFDVRVCPEADSISKLELERKTTADSKPLDLLDHL